jgi:prevent-host-death family protein
MANVGMQEAKRSFSKLIAAVEAGEVVILERYGKPVARLVRFEEPKTTRATRPPTHQRGVTVSDGSSA